MSHVRLLRVAMAAAGALLVLKSVAIVRGFDPPADNVRPAEILAPRRAEPVRPVAPDTDEDQTFGRAITRGRSSLVTPEPVDVDITGAIPSKPKEPKPTAEKPATAGSTASAQLSGGKRIDVENPPPPPVSPAERDLLERLGERRRALETRQRELDARENLIGTAEKKVEDRLQELKAIEARLEEAAKQRERTENEQNRSLVTMYEAMRPKDAAKVFERLDIRVLIDVATRMNPRKLSEVLAAMTPDAASRLTSALARRGEARIANPPGELVRLPPPRP